MPARYCAQKRRFAGTIRPDQRDPLALLDVEGDITNGLQQPVPYVQRLDRE